MGSSQLNRLRYAVQFHPQTSHPLFGRRLAVHLKSRYLREVENVTNGRAVIQQANGRMVVDAEITHRVRMKKLGCGQEAEREQKQ